MCDILVSRLWELEIWGDCVEMGTGADVTFGFEFLLIGLGWDVGVCLGGGGVGAVSLVEYLCACASTDLA